jgi:DinB family protein
VGRAFVNARDDSHDLAALRARVITAREKLARLPISKPRHAGPLDPSTGESWHRGNVLGHMGEMLPYWTDQIRRAKAGSGKIGRDEAGAAERRDGIDRGDAAGEAELKRSVDRGLEGVLKLLEKLSPDDLERHVVFHNREGEREARIGELLQTLVVVHVEGHLAQLGSLD